MTPFHRHSSSSCVFFQRKFRKIFPSSSIEDQRERKKNIRNSYACLQQYRNTNVRVSISLKRYPTIALRARGNVRCWEMDTEHCVTELILKSNDRIKVTYWIYTHIYPSREKRRRKNANTCPEYLFLIRCWYNAYDMSRRLQIHIFQWLKSTRRELTSSMRRRSLSRVTD